MDKKPIIEVLDEGVSIVIKRSGKYKEFILTFTEAKDLAELLDDGMYSDLVYLSKQEEGKDNEFI